MGTRAALAPASPKQRNLPLTVVGFVLLVFSAFQLSGIFWPLRMLAYLGAPRWVFQLSLAQRVGIAILAASVTAVLGLYALSACGHIRRLPFLRTGLALAALVFLHRFVLMFSNALRHDPIPVRFVVMSIIVLCIGLVYLQAFIRLMRSRKRNIEEGS